MVQKIKIKSVVNITHDVLRLIAEKPKGLNFKPGQAAEISINKKGWEKKIRAFAFTSLPHDGYIEFNIKIYLSFKGGVLEQLLSLKEGDELLFHNVIGTVSYKGEGLFIAGGTGITPFIAIFKHLEKTGEIGNNKLLFANKTKEDILLENPFEKLLGDNFINILSDEKREGYEHGFISKDLIQKHLEISHQFFYICGPTPMMKAVEQHLADLGIEEEKIVREKF